MQTTMISLDTLNQKLSHTSEWSGLTLKTRWAVGRTGSSRRGTSGSHLHLLYIKDVVADATPAPNRVKVGDVFSINGDCNNNGQRNGKEVVGQGLDAVTCKKCLKRVEELNRWLAKQEA